MKKWLVFLVALAATPARAAGPDAGQSPTPAAPIVPVAPPPVADAADAGEADAGQPDDGSGLASLPPAQPLSFKAILEKAEVTIGDPFGMTIEVRHSDKETYSFPDRLDLHDFGVRDHQLETHGQDPLITIVHLTLQAFETGERTIPALHLRVDAPDGARQLEIPSQKIKVAGIIDDSQGPPQMKEDLKALPTRYRWILWPLWLLAALLIGAGGAWWMRHLQTRPKPAPPPVPRMPPYEEAMARLKTLEDENLVGAGEKQTYYFRLSEILRDFLGRRYEFESLEMTSDELLDVLRQRATPGLDYDGLAHFLRDSDLVKFAKREATDGESKLSLEAVRALVQRARPLQNPFDAERRPA